MAVPFLPFVLKNLNSLIQNEVGLLCGVNKEMKKLSSTLSTIQAVLEDAEQKQLHDKAIQNWLKELNDAAYEADDILDECATEALQCELKGQGYGSLKKVSTSLLTCYPVQNVLFRHKIGNRIKEITQKLDAIAANRKFHLTEGVVVVTRVEYDVNRETSSVVTEPQLYGRDEDKEKIVKFLVEDVCDIEDVSVYPILGIGGLGKTTLAQMAFNDERVKPHFDPKIWVYVSQDFDVKRVIKATIESANEKACEAVDLDPLQRKLRNMLNGKRYLIVLDDVWDEDPDKWDAFKYSLACGSKGASIIVTTRVDKVASIMGTISPHRLSVLSKEDCWLLFRQRAFGLGNEERPNIVAIGKEIVKKCGGVPLAAKALGGLMRFKSEEKEWLHVKESEIWKLPQDKNSILPALRLSYFYLPLESRQCFAYCAIFPKGSQIQKRDLIHLWMANGYISCKGGWEPEDIGDQIWNELCLISFFQEVKDYKSDICFEMHDLVHDLAQSIMKGECQMIEFNSSSNIYNRKAHHVTLVVGLADNFNNTFHKVESLRTLRLQRPSIYSFGDDFFLCDFRVFGSLRAFDAPGRVAELPPSIGNSKHLRYLNLSYSGFKQLPDSICNLLNLQTLILYFCLNLERLPQNMMYLRSLRHLFLSGCLLIEMPPKIGQLTNLKTLNKFVVGKSTDCSLLAELKCLNLQGELRIWHLERVRNPMAAKEANLVGKQNLSQLQLIWKYGLAECESQENVKSKLVLEALQPHTNLKKLAIIGYKGTQFPLWMRGSDLQNVVNIRLSRCNNCLQLPPLGQLPLLQSLEIDDMEEVVECIENEYPGGGGFPSLEELTVRDCLKLEGLSREEGRELFPRLRVIHIARCPKLSFPHLSAPKELSLVGECTMGLNSISNLNSLTSLTIRNDGETVCFPKEFLRNLTLLESLVIVYCYELKVLPGDLASLVTLKSLKINGCPKLESLPEEGLRGLESLQSLHIIDCCELERRCEKGKGEDWCYHALWVAMAVASIEVAVASDALLVGRFWVVHGLHKLYKLIVTVYGTPRGTHLHRSHLMKCSLGGRPPMFQCQDKNSILPALRLSYFYLPLESRHCFAYCAIFPKGSRIRKGEIIHLWMSNGYISCKGGWEPEDIGDQICNELCLISFSQEVKDYGSGICFKMHDLVHDLAQSIMKGECQMIEFNSSNLRMFGSLRAFDAWGRVKELPPSIGNSKHLRYLNLSHSGFKQLPDSICNLLNLQTLILDYCSKLERLPQNMSLLAELKCLNLKEELRIWHLERVRNPMDAKEANLVGMRNLSQLHLTWRYGLAECESQENVESEAQENVKSELVLEALQPHPNLKKLAIIGYKGTQFPLWMRGSDLQNVVNIRLSRCNNCLQLPPLGQLPLLQRLKIDEMEVVGCIEIEYPGGGGFPSLEELTVRNCPKLEGLSREEGRELFPHLRKIIIAYCPKLSFSHLSAPKELSLVGECTTVLNSISNLNSLTSLTIGYDHKTICFSKEFLRNLTLLESLEIENCHELKVLPGDLASLVTLKSLKIKGCPKLESLPEEGLRGLESLQSLHIINCCELERRCKKGKGEDWYKIAHIPKITIKDLCDE
ncbi:hypothetical protein ACSBR1_023974 [Camellia fascicularis]